MDGNKTAASGGGGGYYGGKSSSPAGGTISDHLAVSSSGTSYVSGYDGCNSVDTSGVHTGSKIHNSGYFFTKPLMLDGLNEFPAPNSTYFETGHSGNGAVRITLLYAESCYYHKLPHGTFCIIGRITL